MMTLLDSQKRVVILDKELGRGGQGMVYQVRSSANGAGPESANAQVAKLYLVAPSEQTAQKLQAMTAQSTAALQAFSAWPSTVLQDGRGNIQGFVMPLIGSEYQELHQLYRLGSRRQLFPNADWAFLVHVARNVTRAFAALHQAGHLMGDVSARNVMVSPQGMVRLLDTDSFQIAAQGHTFACPVGTPEFTPPELQGQHFGTFLRQTEHDLFGLAVLIFHLLFEGRHPYAGVHRNGNTPSLAEAIAADQFAYSLSRTDPKPPPLALTLGQLHPSVADFFERAFSARHQGRPSAAQWENLLAELSTELSTCPQNSAHKYDRRLPCPWCQLEAQRSASAGSGSSEIERELTQLWQKLAAIRRPAAPHNLTLPPATPLPLPAASPSGPLLTLRRPFRWKVVLWLPVCLLSWQAFTIAHTLNLFLLALGTCVWVFGLLFDLDPLMALEQLLGILGLWKTRQVPGLAVSSSVSSAAQLRGRQRQAYSALLVQAIEPLERQADELRHILSQEYARQQRSNAHRKFLEATRRFDIQRQQFRELRTQEWQALTQEQSIEAAALAEHSKVKQRFATQRRSLLGQLEREINELPQEITFWQQQDEQLVRDIARIKGRLDELEATLKLYRQVQQQLRPFRRSGQ